MSAGSGRFPPLTRAAAACTAYLLVVGLAFAAWHLVVGTTPFAFVMVVCAAPVVLCAVFGLRSQHDRRQYIARPMATVLMAPILLLFWSIDGPTQPGLGLALAIAFVLLHAAVFVLAVKWMGAFTTRIEPAAGTPVASTAALVQRLAALASLGLPLDLHADPAQQQLHLAWTPAGPSQQRHHVTLHLQPQAAQVEVLEQLRGDGTAPADADQASMRSPGDPYFDPTCPEAQKVWSRTAQSTMLDEQRLAAAPVALVGDRLVWRGAAERTLPDTDALMACLAVIVVQSGWCWAPQLRT
ncbi:MAG: hypothetical protein QM722_02420 [Piscinibacter sp.]